ncbi:hypothetical protein F5B21DRAFT_457892 [Xylaria acuta]|nr:hypothetical protein F5B21DRAFT_457892 [Xylaria acuta]
MKFNIRMAIGILGIQMPISLALSMRIRPSYPGWHSNLAQLVDPRVAHLSGGNWWLIKNRSAYQERTCFILTAGNRITVTL